MKSLFITMLAMLFAFGANAEVKKAVFTVNPKMSCQNCENKIKSNLRFEKGVKNIETSLDDQTVTVTYDDTKTTPEKLTAGLKKIGYAANPAATGACQKTCAGDKKCDGKCSADKKCDGKCQKAEGCCKNADKKCDGNCQKAEGCCKDKAEKKCDGKCQKAEGCCKDKAEKK